MEEVYVVKKLATHSDTILHSKIRKIMKKNQVKTIMLNAHVAVSKTETGMDYVQVMPDNPRVGLTAPFHGMGYGQMLNNGSFDFVRKKRIRKKPELKLEHSSVSFGNDGYDRYVFILPSEQREDFCKLLMKEATKAGRYVALTL